MADTVDTTDGAKAADQVATHAPENLSADTALALTEGSKGPDGQAYRDAFYNRAQDDPKLMDELGLVNNVDQFFAEPGEFKPGDVPLAEGQKVGHGTDGKQDVLTVTDGNTTTYLGKDRTSQSFAYNPGADGQPGSVEVTTNGGEPTKYDNVKEYKVNPDTGVPEITTADGKTVVVRAGGQEETTQAGFTMVRDKFGGDVSGINGPDNKPLELTPDQLKTASTSADGLNYKTGAEANVDVLRKPDGSAQLTGSDVNHPDCKVDIPAGATMKEQGSVMVVNDAEGKPIKYINMESGKFDVLELHNNPGDDGAWYHNSPWDGSETVQVDIPDEKMDSFGYRDN